MASVLAPIDSAPDVRVRVPPMVTLLHIVTALLTVRFFKVTAGRFVAAPAPMTIFEVAPPTTVPQFITPFRVSVFAPIDKPAPPGLKVPLTAGELCKVTMLELVTERPLRAVTLVGIRTPADVPPKTRLDVAAVTKFEGVPAIVGPFNVSVFAPTVKVPVVRVRIPFTVSPAPNVIFLLVLKLFNPLAIAFSVTAAPVPTVRLEVAPPVREPAP